MVKYGRLIEDQTFHSEIERGFKKWNFNVVSSHNATHSTLTIININKNHLKNLLLHAYL